MRALAVLILIASTAHAGERVLLTGSIHPANALDVVVPATDESPLTVRWLVANGATVKAGDRIAELDASPFTARLRQGRTQLASAEAQFKLAQHANAIQLADKKASLRTQQIAVAKAKIAAEVPADLVTERAAQDNAMALAQAESDLEKASRDGASAAEQIALDERIKRIDLDRTRRTIAELEQAIASLVVTAPRAGTVVIALAPTGHAYRIGDTIERAEVIASQPDPNTPMEVRAELADVDDGEVVVGARGTCTLDAYPAEPRPCTVAELAAIARPQAGHGSLRRAFAVRLTLAPGAAGAAAHLRAGMSVKVELRGAR